MVFALSCVVALSGCPEEATDPVALEAPAPRVPLARYDAPSAPVEVLIDDAGMAHIRGATGLDVFFGAGYQQAVDRLFEIEVNRRSATGTLAEVLGVDRLAVDQQARTFDFKGLAEATVAHLAEVAIDDHDLLVAFVGGLNRRVDEVLAGRAEAPPEFARFGFSPSPFTPAEILAIGIRIQFGFSSTLEFDLLYTVLQRLAPGAENLPVFMPVGDAVIMAQAAQGQMMRSLPLRGGMTPSPADLEQLRGVLRRFRRTLGTGEGSNAWVVNGAYTFNGRPILANDSHARLRDPNVMYPYHMTSADGVFDVMGMAFVGVPGIHVGHNRRLVWGATTHFADVLDLYDVDVNDEGALLGDERVPVVRRTEVIRVKTAEGLVEESLAVDFIPGRGIFLPPEILPLPPALVADGRLMLVWPGFEPTVDLSVFLDLNRARNLDDFGAAIEKLSTGMQNWMGATAEGMRYRSVGRVPDRGPKEGRATPNQVMDATDPRALWSGKWMDLADLPALDGSQPFLATANNDVWGHTLDNDPLNDDFYYGSFFAPGFRASRLKSELARQIAEGPITPEATQALQLEVFSPLADRLLALLAPALGEADAALRETAETLVAWDRQMTRDSEPAALFRLWVQGLARALLADDMGLLFDAVGEAEPVYMAKLTLLTLELDLPDLVDGSRNELLLDTLREAVALHDSLGRPTWGDLHRAELSASSGGARLLTTPGDDSSLNVAQTRCFTEEYPDTCVSESGAVYRMVTWFDDAGVPVTRFNCPSCLPNSDADWVEGRFRELPFEAADVEARTVRRVVIE